MTTINTLIAIAVIDRSGESVSVAEVAKRALRVDASKAALADVLMVIDHEGTVIAASALKGIRRLPVTNGGPERIALRLDTVAKPPAVVGLDFTAIVNVNGPNPVRLLELDVDGRNRLQAADTLSAATVAAAKGSNEPEAPSAGHNCKAKNFFGEQCQVKVAKRGGLCVWHSGTKCGAEATGTTRPCQMTVARAGDHCVYHGGPAKKSRKTKAA